MRNNRKKPKYPESTLTTLGSYLNQHKYILTIVIFIVFLLLADILPFGGNIRFYSKWIECNRKPVASDTSLGFGANPPSYKNPASIELLRFGQPTYFCSALEAEQAGYSASPDQYQFPELDKLKSN